MIASVRGEVLDVALDHVVIEAAGVGYKLMATPSTLATLRRGSEARLITAMIVREDSMTLYGFPDAHAADLTGSGQAGLVDERGHSHRSSASRLPFMRSAVRLGL